MNHAEEEGAMAVAELFAIYLRPKLNRETFPRWFSGLRITLGHETTILSVAPKLPAATWARHSVSDVGKWIRSVYSDCIAEAIAECGLAPNFEIEVRSGQR